MDDNYYVYIVLCSDGSHYTGIAKNLKKRIREHYYKKRECAKYTKSRNVVEIDAVWQAQNKAEALKLEYAIKRLEKAEKLDLISRPEKLGTEYAGKLSEYKYVYRQGITLESCISEFDIL